MSCDNTTKNTPPCYLSEQINKHTHDDFSDSDDELSPAKIQKSNLIHEHVQTLANIHTVTDITMPVMPMQTFPAISHFSQPQSQFITATPPCGGDAGMALPVQYVPTTAQAFSNNNVDRDRPIYTESEEKEAEDIVRKLCKNGKLMEFQEGEDFIKVIVYEDSQEDNEDTQSADENEDQTKDYGCNKRGKSGSINLLDCLTEKSKMDNRTSTSVHAAPAIGPGGSAVFPGCSLPNMPPPFSTTHTPGERYTASHARPGFMYYNQPVSMSISTPQAFNTRTPNNTPVSTHMKPAAGCSRVQLNSSGEEVSLSDPLVTPSSQQLHSHVRSLMHLPPFNEDETGKVREQHNQKERRRRARIKEACNLLRQLVPGMSDKTDKATVFEFAARYVHFLKSHTGAQYDKDFLMKYSPY